MRNTENYSFSHQRATNAMMFLLETIHEHQKTLGWKKKHGIFMISGPYKFRRIKDWRKSVALRMPRYRERWICMRTMDWTNSEADRISTKCRRSQRPRNCACSLMTADRVIWNCFRTWIILTMLCRVIEASRNERYRFRRNWERTSACMATIEFKLFRYARLAKKPLQQDWIRTAAERAKTKVRLMQTILLVACIKTIAFRRRMYLRCAKRARTRDCEEIMTWILEE